MEADLLISMAVWGLYAGCIYILLAIGLNLIFGVMKVVNFAHGEFLMIAAYVVFLVQSFSGLDPYLIIPVSMAFMAVFGLLVERLCFRPLMGAGKLNEIFLSLGLIYVFQNFVAFLFSNNNRSVHSPYAESIVSFGGIRLPLDYAIIIGITAFFILLFYVFMKKTSLGMAMRATSQNREAAALMGVDVERMDVLSFSLGSALAAAAGSLWVISGKMADPFMGPMLAIKAFAVVIIGGLGSIPGAIIAGLLLGLAENVAPSLLQMLVAAAFGSNVSFNAWKDVIAFGILIVVLVVKPTGLFGESGE